MNMRIMQLLGMGDYKIPDDIFRDSRTPMQRQIEMVVGNGVPVTSKFVPDGYGGDFDSHKYNFKHNNATEFDLQAHLAEMEARTSKNPYFFVSAAKNILDCKRLLGPFTTAVVQTPEQVRYLVQEIYERQALLALVPKLFEIGQNSSLESKYPSPLGKFYSIEKDPIEKGDQFNVPLLPSKKWPEEKKLRFGNSFFGRKETNNLSKKQE
jgi:hypothetical protein